MNSTIEFTRPQVYHYDYDLSKNWFVGFELTNPVSGEKVRKQFRGGINYSKKKSERIREANALRDFWQKQLEDGLYNPFKQLPTTTTNPTNIEEALNKIIELKTTSLKKKSIRNYTDISRWFLDYCAEQKVKDLPLHLLPTKIGRMYLDYLLVEKKLSGNSHNNQMSILKAMFNSKMETGREWINFNPFKGFKELPTGVGNNIAYTNEERTIIRDFLHEHDRRLYYCTQYMFHCFIRKTELTTIRVGDIDWNNKTIKIDSKSSKNRIQDSVTIPEGLMPILEEMNLKHLPDSYWIFGKNLETCATRLTRPDDISDRHLSAKRAIIEKLNSTTLRHNDGKTL